MGPKSKSHVDPDEVGRQELADEILDFLGLSEPEFLAACKKLPPELLKDIEGAVFSRETILRLRDIILDRHREQMEDALAAGC